MAIGQQYVADYDRVHALCAYNAPMLMLGRHRCQVPGVHSARAFFAGYGVDDYRELDLDGGDLRLDLNEDLHEISQDFATVFNLGTLEHVWNVHAAWSNALRAVRVGGHFVTHSPIKGWVNHGIHLTGERYIADFVTLNGFRTLERWTGPGPKAGDELLMLVARKTQHVERDFILPMQVYHDGVKPS